MYTNPEGPGTALIHRVGTDRLEILKVDSHVLFQSLNVIFPFFPPVVSDLRETLWPHTISRRGLFGLLRFGLGSALLALLAHSEQLFPS